MRTHQVLAGVDTIDHAGRIGAFRVVADGIESAALVEQVEKCAGQREAQRGVGAALDERLELAKQHPASRRAISKVRIAVGSLRHHAIGHAIGAREHLAIGPSVRRDDVAADGMDVVIEQRRQFEDPSEIADVLQRAAFSPVAKNFENLHRPAAKVRERPFAHRVAAKQRTGRVSDIREACDLRAHAGCAEDGVGDQLPLVLRVRLEEFGVPPAGMDAGSNGSVIVTGTAKVVPCGVKANIGPNAVTPVGNTTLLPGSARC